jgi:2-iminobutanoate/2-iminopropanoate deaminase
MAKKIVRSSAVAQPIGPYSLATRSGNFIFVAGTVGWRADGQVPSDFREQARQMYENVKAVLAAEGATMADVLSTTTYLVRASDYPALNEVRRQYFQKDPPASAVVVVAGDAHPAPGRHGARLHVPLRRGTLDGRRRRDPPAHPSGR